MAKNKSIYRTLNLKAVRYRTRKKDFKWPRLETILKTIFDNSSNIGSRLYPESDLVRPDDWHCFINDFQPYKGGYIFQHCSYIPGQVPISMLPDLQKNNLKLNSTPIVDENGSHREVVYVTHVFAYGNILLVEGVKGAGGIGLLEEHLTYLTRKFYDDKHPNLHLVDAVTQELHKAIESGGGACAVNLNLAKANVTRNSAYAETLSEISGKVRNSDQVTVRWKSSRKLNSKDVENIYDEAEHNDALDRVSIELNNGQTITLDKFRIRSRVEVPANKAKQPDSDAIIRKIKKYYLELQRPDDDNNMIILTSDGHLADAVTRRE